MVLAYPNDAVFYFVVNLQGDLDLSRTLLKHKLVVNDSLSCHWRGFFKQETAGANNLIILWWPQFLFSFSTRKLASIKIIVWENVLIFFFLLKNLGNSIFTRVWALKKVTSAPSDRLMWWILHLTLILFGKVDGWLSFKIDRDTYLEASSPRL